MSGIDETAAFLRHLEAERVRLALTGDTRPGSPPILLTHAGLTIYRVFKDGDPFTRTFWFATAPVRSEFDEGVFDVRELDTWLDAVGRTPTIAAAIPVAIVGAIDAGELR